MSILEISHRSKQFEAVIDESVQLVKELYQIPDGYSVVFLQGGASLQFDMIPMNLLNENETAAYLNNRRMGKQSHQRSQTFWKREYHRFIRRQKL